MLLTENLTRDMNYVWHLLRNLEKKNKIFCPLQIETNWYYGSIIDSNHVFCIHPFAYGFIFRENVKFLKNFCVNNIFNQIIQKCSQLIILKF